MKKGVGKIILGVVFLVIAIIMFYLTVIWAGGEFLQFSIFLVSFLISVILLIWGIVNLRKK